jgi:hypothetical protein
VEASLRPLRAQSQLSGAGATPTVFISTSPTRLPCRGYQVEDRHFARNLAGLFDSQGCRTSHRGPETTRGERLHGARLQHVQQAHRRWQTIDDGVQDQPSSALATPSTAAARRPRAQRLRHRRLDPHPARDGSWSVAPDPQNLGSSTSRRQAQARGRRILDANGKRLDKENFDRTAWSPTRRRPTPTAQFIQDCWGALAST